MAPFGIAHRNQKTFRPKKNGTSSNKVRNSSQSSSASSSHPKFLASSQSEFCEDKQIARIFYHPSLLFQQGARLKRHIDATLGSGNLREAVRLPPGVDLNEWLAVNTDDFFNQVNVLYGTLDEFCTPTSCPVMSAGPNYEYRWADGVQIKRPIEVSAPKYVDYLMDWVEAHLNDEDIFPKKLGAPFPPNFRQVVATILKRLFRIYAHIYHSHFQKIVSLKEEAHLNTCFKHFTLFTSEFHLIEERELAPLRDLIDSILQAY
ncbi:MOB kinase activator-like 1A isoform X2 [Curcuma longa]|uniref:MOB kinase activator-like 1A isoform X2 n=1 Tax=Curcuma longa TaxID=136217 RepID=UPI003D9E03A6